MGSVRSKLCTGSVRVKHTEQVHTKHDGQSGPLTTGVVLGLTRRPRQAKCNARECGYYVSIDVSMTKRETHNRL